MPKTKKAKTKKPKTLQDVFKGLGVQVSSVDFGSGRHGNWVDVWSPGPDPKFVGSIQLVRRNEDGEYSVSFKLATWLESELARVGAVIHKRAKPTRKVLNVYQMLRQGT